MIRSSLIRFAAAPPPVDQLAKAGQTALAKHASQMQKGIVSTKQDESTLTQAGIASGAPPALTHRTVRIFRPTPSTMQSGKAGYNHWRLDFDTLAGGGRWINPLMGWASSADYMQGTALKFASAEAAIAFCTRQGWDYQVATPNVTPLRPKQYAENFVHQPGKLRLLRTK